MKDFRVLNIVDSEMEVTNQRIAIIELVEVEYQDFGLSNSDYLPYIFGGEGKRFIVDFNSYLTKSIIGKAQNEEIVRLDLSEFRFREEIKNGQREEIAYHKNVHLVGFEETPFDSLQLDDISYSISLDLNKRLENAFEDLKEDTTNPLVIAHLQSSDKKANVYLVAKDPNDKMYYGILETEFTDKRQLMGIPESNIRAIEVREVSMKPFGAKKYIEEGIKE